MNLYTTRTGRIISAVHTATYYLQFISDVQPWNLELSMILPSVAVDYILGPSPLYHRCYRLENGG